VTLDEQFASAGGCEIQYRELGPASAPTVVILHGGGGFRLDQRVFDAVAEHYHLLVPSMPGFDGSSAGACTDVVDIADVMAEFIRRVAGGRTSVIGESFGGGVAAWLAARHPEVVEHLILAAPAGLRAGDGPRLLDLTPAQVSVLLYGRPPDEQPTPEEAQRRTRNRQNSARMSSARPPFDPELFAQLKHIQAPTLVLWGSDDGMISPASAEYFVGQIPGAKHIKIQGAPHVLSVAAPQQFLAPVLYFLGVPAPA
jgi:pimeloyl-ACP methyl ester carboxylesterase